MPGALLDVLDASCYRIEMAKRDPGKKDVVLKYPLKSICTAMVVLATGGVYAADWPSGHSKCVDEGETWPEHPFCVVRYQRQVGVENLQR